MLRVLRQSHPGLNHLLHRPKETIKDTFTTVQVEYYVESSQRGPGVIEGAPVTEILHTLHDPAVGQVHLRVELVPKGKLADHVNAQPLAPRRHVHDIRVTTGDQYLAQERVDLPCHLRLKHPHRGLPDDGPDEAPFGSVLLFVQGVEQVGGAAAAVAELDVGLAFCYSGVVVDVCEGGMSTDTVVSVKMSDLCATHHGLHSRC